MNLQKILQDLYLSKNEALVYTELLKLGLTNAGPIVSSTHLHRQLVYEALENLITKKLVSVVTKNNRKHFHAAPPKMLLNIIQQKEDQTKKILPELLKLQAGADEQFAVNTFYGQQGFFSNLKDIIQSASKHDKIMRIIGGAPDENFYEAIGKNYDEYVKLLETNKVAKYLISPEKYSNIFKKKFANEKGNILKTVKEGLSSPTYTRITPEMVSIEIYSNELLIIQIYNKTIAKSYREHFDLLWKQAKKYK